MAVCLHTFFGGRQLDIKRDFHNGKQNKLYSPKIKSDSVQNVDGLSQAGGLKSALELKLRTGSGQFPAGK